MIEQYKTNTSLDRIAPLGTLLNGGPGSGDFGHAGRPGQVGGSAPKETRTASKGEGSDSSEEKQWFDTPVRDSIPKEQSELERENIHTDKMSKEQLDTLKTKFKKIFGTDIDQEDFEALTQNGTRVTLDDASDSEEMREKFENDLREKVGDERYSNMSYGAGVYSDEGYEWINNSLRRDKELRGEDLEVVRGLLDAAEQYSSRYNISTFRGETFDKDVYKNLKVGQPLPDAATKAFTSTTTDITVAPKFAREEQYSPQFSNIIKFNIPAGKTFAYMGALGSRYASESEILLKPWIDTEVTKIKEYKAEDGTVNRIIYVDIKKKEWE